MSTNDTLVDKSKPLSEEAVVATNAAPEVEETHGLRMQNMDASVPTNPPAPQRKDDLLSSNSAVTENNIPRSMEYTAGIEMEGWIVGDITYKQTKLDSTILLKVLPASMYYIFWRIETLLLTSLFYAGRCSVFWNYPQRACSSCFYPRRERQFRFQDAFYKGMPATVLF